MYSLTISPTLPLVIAAIFTAIILFVFYGLPKKKVKNKPPYAPGDEIMSWSILESELLKNLNNYRYSKDMNNLRIDRKLHDFANYCARRIATDPKFDKYNLPKEILDTMVSFPFNEYCIMFEDASVLDNIKEVGKALKCNEHYRVGLLDKEFKYIGIGADASVNDKFYYCVILAK